METKSFITEVKANTESRIIESYASTYHKDLINDQIIQGAFKKSINERFPKNQIKFLYQHDYMQPIGLPIHMEEDSKGLYTKNKVAKTRLGDEVLEMAREGILDSFSIGYNVMKDDLSEDGTIRYLKEIQLHEISLVTFPCNPMAKVTGVKNFDYDIEEMSKLIKAGRVLSATNVDKLRSMMAELTALIESAEPPSSTQGTEPPKGIHIFDELFKQMQSYKIK